MKQIRIVAVMSSHHREGNSASLAREALRGAAEAGAETVEIFLSDRRIDFCTGCLACMREGLCHQMDDFDGLRKTLQEADGVLLSSPTYAATVNAVMKNFIDRLGLFEFMTGATLGGKYVTALSTANRNGAARTAAYLASIATGSVFQKARISGTAGFSLGGGTRAVDSPEMMKKARRMGQKLVRDIRAGKTGRRRNPVSEWFQRLFIKPMISSAIRKFGRSEMKGVYQNLTSRGLLS